MKIRSLAFIAVVIAAGLLAFDFSSPSSAQNGTNLVKAKTAVQTEAKPAKFGPGDFSWQTVANNGFTIPGDKIYFSEYGRPSINSNGTVVFRASGKYPDGRTAAGVYTRTFPKGLVESVADIYTIVPFPNNLNTLFSEFPANPGISMNRGFSAASALHDPVFEYDIAGNRVGKASIYVRTDTGMLITGASGLGKVPGFEYFAVPNYPDTAFDSFPGQPAINDEGTLVFKGNFTVGENEKTGIFTRRLLDTPGGGTSPVEMIVSSDTDIPNVPPSSKFKAVTFGSLAPPSVAGNKVVFVGLDNENEPNFGGIYLADLKEGGALREIVSIGNEIPGLKSGPVVRISGATSFDGRYIGFWAGMGEKTKTVRLYCSEDLSPELLYYCQGVDPNSIYDEKTGRWYQEKEVPTDQAMFIYDLAAETTYKVAAASDGFSDFVFWSYTGQIPPAGNFAALNIPSWKPATYCAVSQGMMAFKARIAEMASNNEYINIVDGLYLGDPVFNLPVSTVAVTGMDGALIDPILTANGVLPMVMPVTGLGIDRDGFRGEKLAITASMANAEDSWAGVYVTDIVRGPTLRK